MVKLIANLEKAQDLLGIIHDYDMTITYLKRYQKGTASDKRPLVQQVTERMIKLRADRYELFVNHFQLSHLDDNQNLFTRLLTVNL